ncbi:MAG: PAS domain S-box protein [Candidatus Promineifilaceae bacterium]
MNILGIQVRRRGQHWGSIDMLTKRRLLIVFAMGLLFTVIEMIDHYEPGNPNFFRPDFWHRFPIYAMALPLITWILLELLERSERARSEAKHEMDRQTALNRALLSSAQWNDQFESSAHAIFDSCKRLTGATAAYVALLTEDGKENDVVFLDTGEVSCSIDPTLPMPIRGLREVVYQTGKTVYENDFFRSEWEQFIPSGHARIANVLFAPLKIRGITIGLLGLANKPGGFTEHDSYLASGFGELASLALRNSRSLESLQSSEERFRSVAQTAQDAIITINKDGNIVFWNKAAETIFGLHSEDAVGEPLDFIIPGQHRTRHRKGMERVVSTGETRVIGKTVEMLGVKKDGSEFPLELSLSSFEVKQEPFFTGIIRDITERKRVAETAQSLANFPSENRNPVFRVALDGTILYANDTCTPLMTLWASQAGLNIPEPWRQLAAEAISSGESRKSEIDCDGRIFSLDFAPVVEAGHVNVYGLDVTENKQASALLESQNQFITSVFESLGHPFYVVDANDYTIKIANSAAFDGELPQDITCYALLHDLSRPCDGVDHLCPLQEIRKTGRPVTTEHVHFGEAGNERVYEVHAHPILDSEGTTSQIIEYTLDITERKQMEKELQESTLQLGERVKELNCLYGIAALIEKQGISLERILQESVKLIPPAWQYPEITEARVILDDQEFKTAHFSQDAPWQQAADIRVYDRPRGMVEVCYLEERPESDEGPFLKEERSLVEAIAERVGRIVEREQAEEALRKARDELEERVQKRTGELFRANEKLQAEMAGRKRAYLAEQKARQIAETLGAASQALSQTLDMDKVINTLLDYLGHLVPFDSATVSLLEDESTLMLRAVRGYQEFIETDQIPASEFDIADNPHIHTLLRNQKSIVIADTRKVPDWKTHRGLNHGINWMGLPLTVENNVIGLCGLEMAEPGCFTSEHLQLAEALIGQAVVAIQNAWLFEQVRFGRERLQSLSRRLVEVQETERRYIARELHDEAGQALASLKVGLRLLERDVDRPEAILTGVTELRDMVDGVMDNLHRLAMDLRPASLDHLGLVAASRQYVEDISDKHSLTAQFEVIGVEDRFPPDEETALYRIVQEAMINVVRHSRATRVDVLLRQRGDKLVVIVEDNGVGFDPATVRQSSRLGLFGMRERAEMLGGELLVECASGSGTTVMVEVPYAYSRPDSG